MKMIKTLLEKLMNFGRNKRKKLEQWINVPVTIDAKNTFVEGFIKYGIRKSIK